MPVSALTTSLCATGVGAADAITRSASLVSSAPCSTASVLVRCASGSPSTEASQRRTFTTSSPCVSPSNDNEATGRRYPPLVDRGVGGVVGEPGESAGLATQDHGPEVIGVRNERIAGLRVEHPPGTLGELVLELAARPAPPPAPPAELALERPARPARRPGEEADRVGRVVGQLRGHVEVDRPAPV